MNCSLMLCRGRRGALRPLKNGQSRQPNGFTLMELLIVMAIIAILMLIAIPTVGALKKKANDTSAIQSVRAIMQAQSMYESTYPTLGYACTLSALGGDPKSGPPTPAASQLLQADLTSGVKSGYLFTIGNCTKKNLNGNDLITGYQITATPITVGQTGDRAFCADQFGSIKYDAAGGNNCTQNLQ